MAACNNTAMKVLVYIHAPLCTSHLLAKVVGRELLGQKGNVKLFSKFVCQFKHQVFMKSTYSPDFEEVWKKNEIRLR